MARVVALFEDLMLGSNAQGWLQATGHDVVLCSSGDAAVTALADGADAVVVDLAAGSFDGIDWVMSLGPERPPSLGVYQHTEDDVRRRAESAGFSLVVPRSRFAREQGSLVDRIVRG